MKISKTKLRQIIREELMTERLATVPQVQQMAAAAGVKLSYGDAKALAARTPAERGALIKLKQSFKNGSWRQMREELGESDWYDDENETRADRKYADSQAGLGDLQSDEQFTGGSPEEHMLRRIKARELLAAMSKEELKELSLSLDAETVAELRHLLANPMYAKGPRFTSTGPWAPEYRDK